MKIGMFSIFDLIIFDANGSLIANLNTLKYGELIQNKDATCLVVKNALLDLEILKFLHKHEITHTNDYERMLNGKIENTTTIIFNRQVKTIDCKLIAKGLMQSANIKNIEYTLEIPCACIRNNIRMEWFEDKISKNDLVIFIKDYNDAGDMIKLHYDEMSDGDKLANYLVGMEYDIKDLKKKHNDSMKKMEADVKNLSNKIMDKLKSEISKNVVYQ